MREAYVDVAWSRGRERIPFEVADIGDLSSQAEVKLAIARVLGARCPDLSDYVVLRVSARRYYLRVPLMLRLERFLARVGRVLAVPLAMLRATEQFCQKLVGALEARLRALFAPWARLLSELGDLLVSALHAPLAVPVALLTAVSNRLGYALLKVLDAFFGLLAYLVFRLVLLLARGARPLAALARKLATRLAPYASLLAAWVFGVVDRVLTGRTAAERERDHRLEVLESLLTTPRRDTALLDARHQRLAREDGLFYAHLAAWYFRRGSVRDHQELFVQHLVTDSAHREVGLALLRDLPPYQLARVVTRLKQSGRNVPRSLRTEVERYLRRREADAEVFDGAVLSARKALKLLYSSLHIRPGRRAQQVLFEQNPPAGSRLAAVKTLANTRDPLEQAALIRRYRLPYRVVAGLASAHPETGRALAEQMSAPELLNHLGSLDRKGLVSPEMLTCDRRVSALKVELAARAVGDDWQDVLNRLLQQRLESDSGWITRSTALLVDASASMESALEIGRRLAAMVASVARGPLRVVVFDRQARELHASDYAGWTQAFAPVQARGQSSMGAALLHLYRQAGPLDQVILVSDQRESQSPRFLPALRLLRRKHRWLDFCFVNLAGAQHALEADCRRARVPFRSFDFAGDYYALPNLLPFLAQPSKVGQLLEIMETPLPAR